MFDQTLEGFRKATESSLQVQQDLLKQWAQHWLTPLPNFGASTEWARTIQKRWADLTLASLNSQRDHLEAIHKAGTQLIEQALRAPEAKSPEDYRRLVEDLWRKLLETFRAQSESQLREILNWATTSLEMAQAVPGQ